MPNIMNRLMQAWLLLLGLSVAALLLGGTERGTLGIAGAAGVLAAAVLKGREILLHYLELKHAGRGWRVILLGWLVLVCALVLLAYAAGPLGWVRTP